MPCLIMFNCCLIIFIMYKVPNYKSSRIGLPGSCDQTHSICSSLASMAPDLPHRRACAKKAADCVAAVDDVGVVDADMVHSRRGGSW